MHPKSLRRSLICDILNDRFSLDLNGFRNSQQQLAGTRTKPSVSCLFIVTSKTCSKAATAPTRPSTPSGARRPVSIFDWQTPCLTLNFTLRRAARIEARRRGRPECCCEGVCERSSHPFFAHSLRGTRMLVPSPRKARSLLACKLVRSSLSLLPPIPKRYPYDLPLRHVLCCIHPLPRGLRTRSPHHDSFASRRLVPRQARHLRIGQGHEDWKAQLKSFVPELGCPQVWLLFRR